MSHGATGNEPRRTTEGESLGKGAVGQDNANSNGNGSGQILKVLLGIFSVVVTALIVGFGSQLETRCRDLEHENVNILSQLATMKAQCADVTIVTELRERLILFRERQIENEGKIESLRKSDEEIRNRIK